MEEVCTSIKSMSITSLQRASTLLGNAIEIVSEPFRERAKTISGREYCQGPRQRLSNNSRSATSFPSREEMFQHLKSLKDQFVFKVNGDTLRERFQKANSFSEYKDKRSPDEIKGKDNTCKDSEESPFQQDYNLLTHASLRQRHRQNQSTSLPSCNDVYLGEYFLKTNDKEHQENGKASDPKPIHIQSDGTPALKKSTSLNKNENKSAETGQLKLSLQHFHCSHQIRIILHRINELKLGACTLFIKVSILFNGVRKNIKSRKAKLSKDKSEVTFNECLYIDLPANLTDTSDYLLKIKLYKLIRVIGCARTVGRASIPFGHKDFFLDTTLSIQLQHPKSAKVAPSITVHGDSFRRTLEFEAANSFERMTLPLESKSIMRRCRSLSPSQKYFVGEESAA